MEIEDANLLAYVAPIAIGRIKNYIPTEPTIHSFSVYWGNSETLLGICWGFREVDPS